MVSESAYEEIDKWAMMRINEVVKTCREAYENFEYHIIFHAIHNFCVIDMSNFYLDVLKDRLYVEVKNSQTRRAAQTVIYKILDILTRLVSPILAYTADEIWQFMPHTNDVDARRVVYNEIPEASAEADAEFMARWEKIHALREDAKKALEIARASKVIGSSLDAKLTLYADGEEYEFANTVKDLLKTVFMVSEFELIKGNNGEFKGDIEGVSFTAAHAEGEKCARCWSFTNDVGADSEHPSVCARCASVVKTIDFI